jgi:TolB-like protein/class 3 adenylate cyclase/tetratricopeptide (TPR) repeat protein
VSRTAPIRRLAAIMFTDIVGYTALMAESEEKGLRARERHRTALGPLAEQHHGEVVDENGDELVLSFPSALDAVNCALAAQEELRDDSELRLRIGIHLGDVVFEEGRVYGDGVNVASRIRPIAEPGGICVSGEVQHSIQNQENIKTRSLGRQQLRNVARPVEVFALGRPGTIVGSARDPRPGFWSRGRSMAAALALALVALITWRIWDQAVIAPGPIRSIAVLPLDNLSGDPEQEYFADGMTETLIADLARVRGLRVISRTSSMAYRNSDKTLPQIARELNVDAVVEGSVLRAGDRVRITAQLIQASSDEHLWSDSYDRDLRDILAVHSEVAQAIAGEIELQLSRPAERGQAARPVDPGAFEAYLKGRHHWNKRTGADLRKSIEYFETAIALDPDWALAHSGLAQVYVVLPFYEPSVLAGDSMPRARAAAERALELDDKLAPAHAGLAFVRGHYDWDWEGAEKEFRRAIDLDPSDATTYAWRSLTPPVSIEHAERARELDPLSMIVGTQKGWVLFLNREYDRAIETLLEMLELDPRFALAHHFLARTYIAKGMHAEAIGVAERLVRTDPNARSRATLAHAYAGGGRRENALRIVEEVRRSAFYPLDVAYVYAALGETDTAFAWMEEAYERRQIGVEWIHREPAFDPIRSDPRFDDLRRRIGLPES